MPLANVMSVAGGYSSLALLADGSVWALGYSNVPLQVGTTAWYVGTGDMEPSEFSFSTQNHVWGATATSSLITVIGISLPTPISITGGTYSVNGGAWGPSLCREPASDGDGRAALALYVAGR